MQDTLLVVDDNPTNLRLAVYVLMSAGYDIHTATSGEEALALLETLRPRALIVDVQMPGMDGLTLARRLRAEERWRDLVIVAVTAQAMRGDREAALASGCDEYVTKPIDTRGFAKTIATLLGGPR